ncbi:MAG: efflux RND transporter periplasmic adaptor subunit [Candidatus Moranbacteria bacterium]|nr:efflux RND transporter periplasmic adaptor subunit [Candidatus Moranbacteria bacterium]
MSKKTLFIVAIIVAICGIVAVFLFQRSPVAPYDLVTVAKGTMVQEVSVSGIVEPTTRIDLQFKNSGKLTEVHAEVGQMVKKGDIVAKQDAGVLMSQLKQSESEVVNQEYKLQSVVKNEAKKTNAEKNLINAQKAIVEKASADVRTQMERIGEIVLVAPIDGVIIAVNGEVGEVAKPEAIVVSIMSSDALHIEVAIPETAVANVAVGQTARITLDAFDSDIEWFGKVSSMDPAESVRGGAVYYGTTVLFDKEDNRIRPGMTANVWIKTAVVENALSVPMSAVQSKDGKKIIQVLQEKKVVEKEIVTGLKNDAGMIEIVSGLSQGEQIIIGSKE